MGFRRSSLFGLFGRASSRLLGDDVQSLVLGGATAFLLLNGYDGPGRAAEVQIVDLEANIRMMEKIRREAELSEAQILGTTSLPESGSGERRSGKKGKKGRRSRR